MTIKEATANSLLMFVAATCVVLIVKALPQAPAVPSAGAGAAETPAGTPMAALDNGVIVYYFHGVARCPTCRTIEAYTHEAVQTGFADELKEGTLQWKVVNYQAAENEHFAKDFGLVSASVVLVKRSGGKQVAWKLLPEVWELVGDKAAFVSFVESRLREFQQASSAEVPAAETPAAPGATGTQDSSLPIPE